MWLLLMAWLASGCAPSSPSVDEDEDALEASQDELAEPGFDRHRVLSDAAFTDWEAMSVVEIQAFLDHTPYGGKSALASYQSGGLSAAQAIANAATTHRINPLAILTRAQMEQSLIGKSTASKKALDFAFGCGCPDNQACSETWRGFHKQTDCMASHMRSYLDDLDATGKTIAGFGVGIAKKTLDPQWITPKNNATAALYTYTPWVGSSGSGNLGHFQIWKRFAGHVGYAPVGPGGCAAVAFPAGLIAQSLPSPAMSEAYVDLLVPRGLSEASVPACFLDAQQLVDPSTEGTWSPGSKVSSNFTFNELIVGEPDNRQVLVDPLLVKRLQAMRSSLAAAVTIVDGFRSPERHLDVCEGAACGATLALTLGRAAIITSSANTTKIVNAAAAAGVGTCWVSGSSVYVDVSVPASGCPSSAP